MVVHMTDHVCTPIRGTDDVTEELRGIVREVVRRYYQPDAGMDLCKLLDRIEAHPLDDGTYPDFGDDMSSPATVEIIDFAILVRCGLING